MAKRKQEAKIDSILRARWGISLHDWLLARLSEHKDLVDVCKQLNILLDEFDLHAGYDWLYKYSRERFNREIVYRTRKDREAAA